MAKTAANSTKRFKAVLEKEHGLGWTIARVPFDPAKMWPKMIRHRVRGAVNGATFRTSLFADGKGYYLLVNRETQKQSGVACGDSVEVALEPDMEPRPAELPEVLEVLLDDENGLREWYDALSESMRREIGKWVLGVKSEESQRRRAQQMAERLLATMEAEQELPPLIARALRGNRKANTGWERMTVVQRRQQLLGIFYYQTPEARDRRLQKLLEAAEQHGGR
ncbi:MAG TPA: YdeI/OmpD-associated family protein [Acidobacteriaceae bacterium]|nr:YdeI/OmpD-associated family protein [Acidobacteriaceae bacterium]